MTTASERELQADYADYIYVDDFNRYRTLQLEAESFGDNGPGPLAASSIKPQPFYGIRRPPRHKIEPNWAKVAEKVDVDVGRSRQSRSDALNW